MPAITADPMPCVDIDDLEFTPCWDALTETDALRLTAFGSAGDADPDAARVAAWLPHYYRTFTGHAWRHSRLVMNLLRRSRAVLQAHAQVHDYPCVGILLELENGGFAHKWRKAVWSNPRYDYIGRSARGLDLRIDYFDGAKLQRDPRRVLA